MAPALPRFFLTQNRNLTQRPHPSACWKVLESHCVGLARPGTVCPVLLVLPPGRRPGRFPSAASLGPVEAEAASFCPTNHPHRRCSPGATTHSSSVFPKSVKLCTACFRTGPSTHAAWESGTRTMASVDRVLLLSRPWVCAQPLSISSVPGGNSLARGPFRPTCTACLILITSFKHNGWAPSPLKTPHSGERLSPGFGLGHAPFKPLYPSQGQPSLCGPRDPTA